MANVVDFELDGHAPLSRCFANEDFDKADKAMNYVKNGFLEEKPGTLLVRGGPGTRKTTFLCQAALHLSSKSEKVVCIMNQKLESRFTRELTEERKRQNLSKGSRKNIVVMGVGRKQDSLKETIEGEEELIGPDTVVIIDMINNISYVLFQKFYHKNRMIASVDVSFLFMQDAFNFLVRNSDPNDKILLLTSSNRPELFLQWPKKYLLNGQINGCETPEGAYMKFHDCREAWADFMKKIVEVVNTLRAEDPEGEIGISANSTGEADSIKEALRAAGLRNISIASIYHWQYRTQVKHFIYFHRTCQNSQELPGNRNKEINVGVTRPTHSFHFIGHLETLSKKRQLQFIAFLQWVQGLEMNTTVVLRQTALELHEEQASTASDAPLAPGPAPEAGESAAPASERPVNRLPRALPTWDSAAPAPEARQPSPPPQPSSVNRLRNLVPAPAPRAPVAPVAPIVAPEAPPPPRARQENRPLRRHPEPAPAARRRAPRARQPSPPPQPFSVNRLHNLFPAAAPNAPEAP